VARTETTRRRRRVEAALLEPSLRSCPCRSAAPRAALRKFREMGRSSGRPVERLDAGPPEGAPRRIDAIDDRILELLNRRAKAAIEVGSIKKDRNLNVYVPEREVEILRRLTAVNEGPFPTTG